MCGSFMCLVRFFVCVRYLDGFYFIFQLYLAFKIQIMGVNHLLESYKSELLETGTLELSDLYGAMVEEDIEVYKFLLKHIKSEETFQEVASDIVQEVFYDPYKMYLMWDELDKRGSDTQFIFKFESKRRRGEFKCIQKEEAIKEFTIEDNIRKYSQPDMEVNRLLESYRTKLENGTLNFTTYT